MSLKSQVEGIAQDVTGRVEHLPETLERADKAANEATRDLTTRAIRLIQKHPVRAVVGAFAVGFLIAQVAKRV